ncbi:hypothetical protein PHYSODRAFT_336441 [Phytophthora sojae]|uniref:Calcineurin-like phosphoesterase domain-containing protein n=1 Tax=Phytophthora sojae (strain P6497) TaxID=1094619 RepID=G4ZY54_PHYSP|nr:hypothetical protein PHYSODRAFT_336441 [Phytophthora sojae]EGZ11960.1 hypothetical protein PHYSODRAFT_336441 [Phytophthora sojae]|eukprot:XP_009532293.1 hypothetical protein PHYSODRAFT_336441 [Phytophthora sojae]
MEAEYTAVSVVAQELLGVRELLSELKVLLEVPMKLCFVGDYVQRGGLQDEYLETKEMLADVLAKAVSAPKMLELRARIGLY